MVLALAATAVFLGSEKRAEAQGGLDSTMLVFDLSGSMNVRDPGSGGLTRLDIAKDAMIAAVKGIAPGSRNIGVRGFSGCRGSTLYAPLAPSNPSTLESTINSLSARGLTDIVNALNTAAGDLAGSSGRRTMILLSDGADTCGGDPCAAATALVASGVDVIVHTIGYRTNATNAQAQLNCIANITGGTSISVDNAAQLFDALDSVLTGSARGGVISSPIATCVNSALVSGNAALGALEVGTSFVDDNGVLRVLIAGEPCGYSCVDGHDMNCDGVLGDYCSSNINRNSVAGAAECIAALGGGASSGGAASADTGISDSDAFQAACAAPDASASVQAACRAHAAAEAKAALFTSRAEAARADGDFFLTSYWETLAQAETDKAAAILASAS